MKTLFKVTLDTGEETYVVAEDLSTAADVAECAFAKKTGSRIAKTRHVTVIATEATDIFGNKLHIAREQAAVSTSTGHIKEGGIYQ